MAKYIYLISVLDTLDKFSYILGVFLFFILIILSIFIIACFAEDAPEELKYLKKGLKVLLIAFIVLLGMNVFIPSRDEMYTMFLSKYITIDNYNIVKNEIKEGIDHLDKVLNDK